MRLWYLGRQLPPVLVTLARRSATCLFLKLGGRVKAGLPGSGVYSPVGQTVPIRTVCAIANRSLYGKILLL